MHFCALLSYHFASCNPNPNQKYLKIIEVFPITAGACGTHVLPHAMKINEAVGMSGEGNVAGFLYLNLYIFIFICIVPPLGEFKSQRGGPIFYRCWFILSLSPVIIGGAFFWGPGSWWLRGFCGFYGPGSWWLLVAPGGSWWLLVAPVGPGGFCGFCGFRGSWWLLVASVISAASVISTASVASVASLAPGSYASCIIYRSIYQ